MKYIVFSMAAVFGVPIMTALGLSFSFFRQLLMAALVASTALGQKIRINFVSYELYRGPDRGFEFAATDLIGLAIILVILIRSRSKISWFPSNITWIFLFYLSSFFSVINAPEPLFFGFSILKLSRSVVLFWCCVNYFRTEENIDGLFYGMVSASLIVTYFAFIQKYLFGIYRVPGSFDHSNTIPPFLNMMLPIIIIWSLTDESFPFWKRVLGVVSILGSIFSVASTFSRAGLALSLACVGASLLYVLIKKPSFRVYVFSGFLAVAVIAGMIKAADSFLERIRTAPKSSEEARDEFNEAANKMAKDYFFGVGLNNYSVVLTRVEKYRENVEVMAGEEEAGVCHHIYWLTAAEMGFPGLIIFIIMIGRFCWLFLYSSVCSKELPWLLTAGILIGQSSLHLSGFLEWAFRQTPVLNLFFILSGAAIGIIDRPQIEEDDESAYSDLDDELYEDSQYY
ncbi:MAG: O-antigen ligase family protein [Candidatus Riflebacteria bacterium]|nr:O-antigen ligase family protein [Candidatus Riflebacteria bacterium]